MEWGDQAIKNPRGQKLASPLLKNHEEVRSSKKEVCDHPMEAEKPNRMVKCWNMTWNLDEWG